MTIVNRGESADSVVAKIKAMPREEVDAILKDFPIKTDPKSHQARCLVIGAAEDSWLFANDPGTGKTKLAIDIISANKWMAGKIKAFVVCPPIVIGHWEKEIEKHSHLTVLPIEGTAKYKRHLLETTTADITIASNAWIVRYMSEAMKSDEANDLCREIFSRFDVLVWDESHTLKNNGSVGWAGFVEYLQGIPKRYLLTGTPIGSRFEEFWGIYYLLDKGETFGETYSKFLKKYFDVHFREIHRRGSYPIRIPQYRLKKEKAKEFKSKLWTRAIRYEESECGDLPEKVFINIPLAMTAEQRKKYHAELGKEEIDQFKLRRITSGTDCKSSPKLDAVEELVNEICVIGEQKVIVWHWLVSDGQMIEDHLKKKFKKELTIRSIRGETKKAAGVKTMKDWKAGKVDVLVGNPASIGSGVDLFEASRAIYFSHSDSRILRAQSIKRIHRTGQTKTCYYYTVAMKSTIDEITVKKLEALDEKVGKLFGDVDSTGGEKITISDKELKEAWGYKEQVKGIL